MSKVVLPREPIAPSALSPRKLLLYGVPKVGKTTYCAALPNNLIMDLEEGTAYINALKINIGSVAGIEAVCAELHTQGMELHKAGKSPFLYDYITIDTGDALEEMCDASALAKYKESKLCSAEQKTSLKSITDLSHGLGYGMLRNEFVRVVNLIATYCKRVIIITHVKDKYLSEKEGAMSTVKDISLSGKLSTIVCANMDAIGYLYRNPTDQKLYMSFQSKDVNSTMGSRCQHLAGLIGPADWSKIYID